MVNDSVNARRYPRRTSDVLLKPRFFAISVAVSSVNNGELVEPSGEYACGTMFFDFK
jgi:hypothetical protein